MKPSHVITIWLVFLWIGLFGAVTTLIEHTKTGSGDSAYDVGYVAGAAFFVWLIHWLRKKVKTLETFKENTLKQNREPKEENKRDPSRPQNK